MALEPGEVSLGRELRKRGEVSDEALRRCAADVLSLRASGESVDLARLLVERGLVPPDLLEATGLVPGASAFPRRPSPVATRVASYELRRLIGEGGMGSVHEAWDTSLRRLVALKTIRREGKSPEDLERFRREGRALAALHHPHIVSVQASGETADLLYIAMDFVEGAPLETTRLDGSAREPRALAVLVAKVARALEAAHRAGLVHRDVKPANIVVDAADEPKLVDFGLALALDEREARLTRSSGIAGTPAHLAPEQALGQPVTARTDVHALGVVLYQLTSGRVPFESHGEMAELIYRIGFKAPPPLVNVPGDLARIIMKALEKDPRDRHATAEALALDLEAFARGEPVSARPGGALAGIARRARRHPALTVAALLVPAAILGGVAWARARESAALDEGRRRADAPFDAAFERGRAAEARGAWFQAAAAYQVCRVMRPGDAHAAAGLGRSKAELGSFFRGEELLGGAIAGLSTASSAEQAESWSAYARVIADRLSILGHGTLPADGGTARDAARRARALAPADALVRATEARVEATFAPGDGARALADGVRDARGEAAVELSLARAMLAGAAGDHAAAVAAARTVGDEPPRARVLAGAILGSNGEPEEGIDALAAEVARQPENGTLGVILARAHARRLDFARAAAELAAAGAAGATDPLLARRLARARGEDATLEGPRELLDRAWFLLEERARTEAPRALGLAEEASHSPGTIPAEEVVRVEARALGAAGRPVEALALLDAALARAPADRDLLRVRCPLLIVMKRWTEALADADAILAHARRDVPALRDRVKALVGLGRTDDAIADAEALAAALPDDADIIRATVLVESGRYAEAVATAPAGRVRRPELEGLLAFARRLSLPPLGPTEPPIAAPAEDWGENLGRWELDSTSEPRVVMGFERDPGRVVAGKEALRLTAPRGGRARVALLASEERPFALARARALAFFVRTERCERPLAVDEPISLGVRFHETGGRRGSRFGLVGADAPIRGPGWHRVEIPLDPSAPRSDRDAWLTSPEATGPVDRGRITVITFSFETLATSGVFVWIDGVTPVE
jgi:tetratricopeptide (TPR) repeat protein